MIILTLPFYFYSVMKIRGLGLQLRNNFMPGLCFPFAIGVYSIWYWYDQYVFYYVYHYDVYDYFYQIRQIWDVIKNISYIMLLRQIESVLIICNIAFAKFLKYINYIFFLTYLILLLVIQCGYFVIYLKFLQYYYLFYDYLEALLCIYSFVLLNIVFELSNIKDYFPKKYHVQINISIFSYILGTFSRLVLSKIFNTRNLVILHITDYNILNHIQMMIQLAVNYLCDIPMLTLIWICSTAEFDNDPTETLVAQNNLIE